MLNLEVGARHPLGSPEHTDKDCNRYGENAMFEYSYTQRHFQKCKKHNEVKKMPVCGFVSLHCVPAVKAKLIPKDLGRMSLKMHRR